MTTFAHADVICPETVGLWAGLHRIGEHSGLVRVKYHKIFLNARLVVRESLDQLG